MNWLITSRIWASSSSISRGRLIEISLCLLLTELNSTVILKPSWEQSPRPYPVIDFIVGSMRKVTFSREQNARTLPLARHFQPEFRRRLGNVFVTAPGQVHNHELILGQFWRALDNLGNGVSGFERRDDPLKTGQLRKSFERLIVCRVGILNSMFVA